ncbi:hypothetical protein PQO01_10770 [Lentisphaera marina]|uniref:hypothetical protein n=1 Tax=Lentisphaera marina TaxID=1111041 RepID=UPI0023672BE4|nr:hypothetical protein [Lentisphaera marina]MDD7985432.1 hypothetical protein [Lentisphaera marina]
MDKMEPNDQWDEYDWEHVMRQSDLYAHKYMELFSDFGEVSGADEHIMEQLQEFQLPGMDEDDFDFEIESEPFDPIEMNTPAYFYERDKSYLLLRQVSIGWCNIFSTLLTEEDRPYGVKIIFHLGRALAYYQGSLADGQYDLPASFISAGKRALKNLNAALGLIEDLGRVHKRYLTITVAMMGHLRQVHDAIVDHLTKLRTEEK